VSEPCSANDIATTFDHFGEICGVEFDEANSGLVYVEFKSHESASKCIQTCSSFLNSSYGVVWGDDVRLSFSFNKKAASNCRGSFNERELKKYFSSDVAGSDIVYFDLPWSVKDGYSGVSFLSPFMLILRYWRSDIQRASIRKKSFLVLLLLNCITTVPCFT
jgi:hypothetical protein